MNATRVLHRAVPLLLLAVMAGCEQPQELSILISPGSVTVGTFRKQQFSATVTGVEDQSVVWSVGQGADGGTIDQSGLYTAPGNPGTYTVVATTRAIPAKRASATVTVVQAPPEVSVTISPAEAQVGTGKSATFAAEVIATSGVTNDTSVTWSVQEGEAGGSITAQGVYTAPTRAGEYHVVATSNANPEHKATARVTVVEGVSVQVTSAELGELAVGGTRTFTATVTGSTNKEVVWRVVQEEGGTIDQSGVYTAPATPGTFTIEAASKADETRTGSIGVVVVAPKEVKVTISPPSDTVNGGDTVTFAADVQNASDTSVTWSVEPQGNAPVGTITTGGVYTAPLKDGSYTVRATSNADTSKFAQAQVTVRPVSVSVAPENPAVLTGATVDLTATLQNAANTSVTWSVVEEGGGTLSDASTNPVTYTAPATAGRYTVRATSVQDPSKFDEVVVAVSAAPSTVAVEATPASVKVVYGETTTLSATVTGATDSTVTWSVNAGEGTLSSTGASTTVYTAPTTPGSYVVTVASNEDPSKTATVTIDVYGPVATKLFAHYAADKLGAATGANGEVSSWSNLVAGGQDLTQADATRQPLVVAGVNGRPAVKFDGLNDHVRTALPTAALPQPATIFIVHKSSAGANPANITLLDAPRDGTTANNDRNRIQITQDGSNLADCVQLMTGVSGGTTNASPAKTCSTKGDFHFVMATFNGATSRVRVDAEEKTLSPNKPGTAGLRGLQLGLKQDLSANGSSSAPLPTEIAEVLIYEAQLADADIQKIEAYLRLKYVPPPAATATPAPVP